MTIRFVRQILIDGPPEVVWAALQVPLLHVAIAAPLLRLTPGGGHERFAELFNDGPVSMRMRLLGVLPLGTRIWEIARPVNEPGNRLYAMAIASCTHGLSTRRVMALAQHASGRTTLTETQNLSGWRATLLGPFAWLAQAWRLKRLARLLRAGGTA